MREYEIDVVSICRAFVDLVVFVEEEELTDIGFRISDDRYVETQKFQYLIDRFIDRGVFLPAGPAG